MKKIFLAVFIATLSALTGAQTGGEVAAPPARRGTIDAERVKISAERAKLEAGFLAEDAACYKRFAVNSCLDHLNTRRREARADLRGREIALNDEERKIKGAEQIRKTEEKSSPEKLQEAADLRAKAVEDYQSRLDRDKQKQQDRASVQSSEKVNGEANAEKLKDNRQKARSRADIPATAAEEAKKFNERQKEAGTRRAQHESDQLKRDKRTPNPLPLPE